MHYDKAKAKYLKKKYGKCTNCNHNEMLYNDFVKENYCKIREEYINKQYITDLFTMIFCQYYEPIREDI